MALLLAKGEDFASWRGVEEFAVTYRDAAVKLASRKHPEGISQMLELIEEQINAVAKENNRLNTEVERLIFELERIFEPGELRTVLFSFYRYSYQHFRRFRSASAFFKMSDSILSGMLKTCLKLAKQHIDSNFPNMALVTMGPVGRRETTRFCRLQLALVWEGKADEKQIENLGKELVAWLRVAGIAIEELITPLNANWCGNLEKWQKQFDSALLTRERSEFIELLRLADQSVIFSEGTVGDNFTRLCANYLEKPDFIANLAERCQLLSNGISMMGNLKLEKTGPHRGAFSLLDHALLPLSASVTVICLINGVAKNGTVERLRELVRIGKLDVDLAERAVHAWHCFSEHRINLEQHASPGQDCRDILHLVPSDLETAEYERLFSSLETVGDLQRYTQISFGMHA